MSDMKECTHQNFYDWFLCEHAQRRPAELWQTGGHPCKFSHCEITGQVFCTFNNPARTETGQE